MDSSTPSCRPLLVMEQRNLFGGIDLVMPSRRRGRRGRKLTVEGRFKVGFATALALVVEHGKKALEASEVPAETRCPRCSVVAKTAHGFGTRVIRGKRIAQSWCRDCRALHLKSAPSAQLEFPGTDVGRGKRRQSPQAEGGTLR